MTTPAQQFALFMPTLMAALLVLVCATPVAGAALTLTPNIAWLFTVVLAAHHPRYWSVATAFAMGLLQDVVFATPLGSQALLTVLLMVACHAQASRQQSPRFRVRWVEAALLLVVWHGLLWLIIAAVNQTQPDMHHVLLAGLANALWYPLVYAALGRMGSAPLGMK